MRSRLAGLDRTTLRLWLLGFFLLLALPSAVLIRQAVGQLKWETFHQYQGLAEELGARIDGRLIQWINTEQARSFADYAFLVISGDPEASFLQPSPLSEYPVPATIPGLIGYFQVDAEGVFTTPLMPVDGTDARNYGVGVDELIGRTSVRDELLAVLSQNALVADAPAVADRDAEPGDDAMEALAGAASPVFADAPSPMAMPAESVAEEEPAQEEGELSRFLADRSDDGAEEAKRDRAKRSAPAGSPPVQEAALEVDAESAQGFDQAATMASSVEASTASRQPASKVAAQAAFDRLNAPDPQADSKKQESLGRVEDLQIDTSYASEVGDEEDAQRQQRMVQNAELLEQRPGARKERASLPEPLLSKDATEREAEEEGAAGEKLADLRVRTFESEIDPFEFSRLDSGHFVLFRKVWRDGQRIIQGALIQPEPFLAGVFESTFRETAVSQMSDLVVAFRGEVFSVLTGGASGRYLTSTEELSGELLHQARLSAPLSALELIFSVNRLPIGPGGEVIGWTAAVLASVLVGGMLLMYRLGLRQIELARQQQDFVSSVSHELKTPLTSIRMYGEMLREGWAPEEKKQTYYDYIYDESERLSRLIANVLQLARMTRNDLELDPRSVPVAELLDTVRSKIASQVERAGFELDLRNNAEDAAVQVDADAFTQILINLVDNAIKFSARAETRCIEINAQPAGNDRVRFTVRDFGPGVPRGQMRKIFKLFYRSENELTRETVGTGIGLALVHQLASAMDGQVDVVNREPGAEFRVVLPRAS